MTIVQMSYIIFLSLLLTLFSCNSNKEKNILLIVVDDLGYADLSCTGLAEDVNTPNIDRIARLGVRFTQAYATSPICNPSRVGIITGCYNQRLGSTWYGGPGLKDKSFKTIAELLKDNGYATGYVGKVHYGNHDADTNHRNFPLNHGFDYYFGHTSPRKHYLNHKSDLEVAFQSVKKENERWGQSLRQEPMWENTGLVDTLAFSTELFGEKACEFIDDNKNEPFFLQLSFNAVHNFTHQLPQEYLQKKNLKGYHDWDPATEDYYKWYQGGRFPNNPEGREHYLGHLHFLDMEIGRVLDCLERLKIDKNTLVIFISDNGGSTPIYANNYPLRGSKYVLYEGGIRVPVIFSFPEKYQQNVIHNNVVSAMDILPTICNITNTPIPENVEGHDLTPLLTGKDASLHHKVLIWDSGHETAVRKGKWKLRTASDDKSAKYEMVELELGEFLYDLEADPGETTNLKEKHPEIFKELKNLHKEWKNELDVD